MIQKTVEVNIENGLHARPAGELVKSLKPYNSDVYLLRNGKEINLKSIIQLMSTAIKEDEKIDIVIDGDDEQKVLHVINRFFNN